MTTRSIPRQSATRSLWALFGLLCLVAALVVFGYALLPHPTLAPLLDRLARDGSLESFTPALHQSTRFPALAGGLILAAGAAFFFLTRPRSDRIVSAVRHRLADSALHFGRDARVFLRDLARFLARERAVTLAALGVTLALALVGAFFLRIPMRYDESYTFLVFALKPFDELVADYHLPNNHIFHTLLVRAAYLLFGDEPWVIRLPAYLAGLIVIPLTAWVGRLFYDARTGLLAAVFTAASLQWLDFITNGRGYTLVALFCLLVLGLAVYLVQRKNRFAWFLWILFAALGLYTIPTMLYPFGMVCVWMGLSALLQDTGEAYRGRFLVYLVGAGILVVVLTVIFYVPVFTGMGVDSVTGNRFVSAMEGEAFVESIFARLKKTLEFWVWGIPAGVSVAWGVGFVASLVFHRRMARRRVHLFVPLLLWSAALLIFQRVAPPPRVWSFLLPLAFLWASAGLVFLARAALGRLSGQLPVERLLLVGCLLLGVFLFANQVRMQLTYDFYARGQIGEPEDSAFFARATLEPGDLFVSVLPINLPTRYYFYLHGVPLEFMCGNRCPAEFERVYVQVSEGTGQTLENVLRAVEVDLFIDPDSRAVVHTYGKTVIYRFDHLEE